MDKRIAHSNTILTLRRIALVYVVLWICRLVFWIGNRSMIEPVAAGEQWQMIKGALLFDTSAMVYAIGVWIVLALVPFRFRERRGYQTALFVIYMVLVSVLVVVANMADTIYFRYTQKRFTAEEIFYTGNSNAFQLATKFAIENWWLLLVAVALIVLLWFGYGRRTEVRRIVRNRWLSYAVNTAIMAVVVLLCVAGMRGGFTRQTRPITLSNAMTYVRTNAQANTILANPFCILRTVSNGSSQFSPLMSNEQADRLFTPYHQPAVAADSTSVTGRYKDWNVVIFIVESFSAEHSAYLEPELYADKEQKGYTPFLDSLMSHSLCMRKMYANGTRSIQALSSVLGSIPSFKTPFVLMPQSLGVSRQLPAILRSEGYETMFVCGSERGSMGFDAYAKIAGIDRTLSKEDYEREHGRGDFDGYWGIWDEKMLQFAGEQFGKESGKFMAAMFTLTSHHPYVVPDSEASTLPVGETKAQRPVAYVDRAFGRFFNRFKDCDWFKKTIFVFTADHVSAERYSPLTLEFPERNHTFGFIYTADEALAGDYNKVAQQIDLMPTILDLTGNQEPYFAFGRDLFDTSNEERWSISYDSQYQVVTDNYVFTSDGESLRTADRSDGTAMSSSDQTKVDSLYLHFEALLQQYYNHIQRKSYVVESGEGQ